MNKKILSVILIISLLFINGCYVIEEGDSGLVKCQKLCLYQGLNFDSQTVSYCYCSKIIPKSDYELRTNK